MTEIRHWRDALEIWVRREARPIDKLAHQPRVYALARTLVADDDIDDDILYAAAWLHDIGVFEGHRPHDPNQLAAWDNVAYAMQKAPEILSSLGFPTDKIPAVVRAIAEHRLDAIPSSREAAALHDADALEQLGAIAILRTVSKVGRDTRFATHRDALAALENALKRVPGFLVLETAKKMALGRVEYLRGFLERVREEGE